MTEDQNDGSPLKPSLIQLRMSLDRLRTQGLLQCAGGLFLAVPAVLQLASLDDTQGPRLVLAIVAAMGWLGISVAGFFRLRRARRDRTAFEAEHGPEAGKQSPVLPARRPR